MQRLLQCLALAAVVCISQGCPLPQTGLDYCSPTVNQNGVPIGGFNMRQGSVLGGMPGVPVYAQQQPTPAQPGGAPTPAGAPVPAGQPTPAAQPTAARWSAGAQPASATMPVKADPDSVEDAE